MSLLPHRLEEKGRPHPLLKALGPPLRATPSTTPFEDRQTRTTKNSPATYRRCTQAYGSGSPGCSSSSDRRAECAIDPLAAFQEALDVVDVFPNLDDVRSARGAGSFSNRHLPPYARETLRAGDVAASLGRRGRVNVLRHLRQGHLAWSICRRHRVSQLPRRSSDRTSSSIAGMPKVPPTGMRTARSGNASVADPAPRSARLALQPLRERRCRRDGLAGSIGVALGARSAPHLSSPAATLP